MADVLAEIKSAIRTKQAGLPETRRGAPPIEDSKKMSRENAAFKMFPTIAIDSKNTANVMFVNCTESGSTSHKQTSEIIDGNMTAQALADFRLLRRTAQNVISCQI